MRNFIDIMEAIGRDSRIQFHLSTEADLVPGRTFAQQTRTNSQEGARGEAGGSGIYTTHMLSYWITQLAYEEVDDFPRYCYLVWVREGGSASSVESAHQECSPPSDVTVLALLMDLGEGDDMPDVGKVEWRADRWVRDHPEEIAQLSN